MDLTSEEMVELIKTGFIPSAKLREAQPLIQALQLQRNDLLIQCADIASDATTPEAAKKQILALCNGYLGLK